MTSAVEAQHRAMSPPARLLARLLAEAIGTGLLVVAVVGSGIAAQRLSDDTGLQLLVNAIATGTALTVLIVVLQPVSAAFNPIVTLTRTAHPHHQHRPDRESRSPPRWSAGPPAPWWPT